MPHPSRWSTVKSTDDRSSTLHNDAFSADAVAGPSSLDHYAPSDKLKRNRPASDLNNLKQGALPTRSLTALKTPHDHVLEKLYQHPDKSEGVLPLPSQVDPDERPPTGDSRTTSKETNQCQATGATPAVPLFGNTLAAHRLYDPFDGSPMGIITLPVDTALRDVDGGLMLEEEDANEKIWNHLSRVLELQNQVARMHVDMEKVGSGKQTDAKGKGSMGNASKSAGFSRPRTTSESSAPGADMGDEEVVDAVDEEAEKLKAREREFKKLATQFEGRKEAINGVMAKLDELSKALTEFHSLQAPKLEFPGPSRNSSLASNTNDHAQPPHIIPTNPTSPVSSGDNNTLPSTASIPVSTPLSTPSNPAASTQVLTTSLSRRRPLPGLIIEAIEPGAPKPIVDSPVSTVPMRYE